MSEKDAAALKEAGIVVESMNPLGEEQLATAARSAARGIPFLSSRTPTAAMQATVTVPGHGITRDPDSLEPGTQDVYTGDIVHRPVWLMIYTDIKVPVSAPIGIKLDTPYYQTEVAALVDPETGQFLYGRTTS
ncbi:MAG: hypothetical protein QM582_14410 [Micropruina sp.]|uniref:hypothetical protein n=1 Tax=Micropruina sp. TaxID=2737536 RepID=UPI0039E4625B